MFNIKQRMRSWWLHLYTRLFFQYDVLDNQPWHSNLKSYFSGLKDPLFYTPIGYDFTQAMSSWIQELQSLALPLEHYKPLHSFHHNHDFFIEHELRRRQIHLHAQAAQLCISTVKELLHAKNRNDSISYTLALEQLNAPHPLLSGQTFLGFFAGTHLSSMIQALLQLGADPLACDQFGKTPLQIAEHKTQQLQSGAGLAQHQAQQALLVQSLLLEHQLERIIEQKPASFTTPHRL